MEFKELKNKNESELQKLLASERDKLRDLKFKEANKQLKNLRDIRGVRKLIAKILTLINSQKKK